MVKFAVPPTQFFLVILCGITNSRHVFEAVATLFIYNREPPWLMTVALALYHLHWLCCPCYLPYSRKCSLNISPTVHTELFTNYTMVHKKSKNLKNGHFLQSRTKIVLIEIKFAKFRHIGGVRKGYFSSVWFMCDSICEKSKHCIVLAKKLDIIRIQFL